MNLILGRLLNAEVIDMPKHPKKSEAGTNVEEVKKQNQKAAQGKYEAEFAEETDAQSVKEKNQKAEQNKK